MLLLNFKSDILKCYSKHRHTIDTFTLAHTETTTKMRIAGNNKNGPMTHTDCNNKHYPPVETYSIERKNKIDKTKLQKREM